VMSISHIPLSESRAWLEDRNEFASKWLVVGGFVQALNRLNSNLRILSHIPVTMVSLSLGVNNSSVVYSRPRIEVGNADLEQA